MFREFVVAQQRQEDDRDRDTVVAYSIAALSRAKKLPDLRVLLARNKRRKQTVSEQKSMLHILSAQYGIPLRRRPKGRRIRA